MGGGGGVGGGALNFSQVSREMEKWGENLCIFHANFLQLYESEQGKGNSQRLLSLFVLQYDT